MAKELPKVIIGDNQYYIDERLNQIRNVKNPNEYYELMSLTDFMALDNKEKEKCFHITKSDNKNFDEYALDIGIYDKTNFGTNKQNWELYCELCNIPPKKIIGTKDIREPKFCFKCFMTINQNHLFVKM